MFCSQCGNRLDKEDRFCVSCGAKVKGITEERQQNEQETQLENQNEPRKTSYEKFDVENMEQEIKFENEFIIDPVEPLDFNDNYDSGDRKKSLLSSFVGKNQPYYLKKWDIENSQKPKKKWNFAAAFLSIGWLGYRKMYGAIFVLIGFYLVIDAFMYFTQDTYYAPGLEGHPVDIIIAIVVFIVLGNLGNYWYYQKADRETEKAILKHQDYESQKREVELKGGTSAFGVFVGTGIFVAYTFISAFLFPYVVEPIYYVKTSYFEASNFTVEDEFGHYFDDRNWKFYRDGEDDFVVFTGTDRYMNQPVEIVFWLGNDMWVVEEIYVDNARLTDYELNEYINYILE